MGQVLTWKQVRGRATLQPPRDVDQGACERIGTRTYHNCHPNNNLRPMSRIAWSLEHDKRKDKKGDFCGSVRFFWAVPVFDVLRPFELASIRFRLC